MSALCQKQTFRAAERTSLFDHLVGTREQRWRNGETKRSRRFEVDHRFVPGWRLYWQVRRFLALEDAIGVAGRLPVQRDLIGPIGNKPASGDEGPFEVDCGQLVPGCKCDDQIAMEVRRSACCNDQAAIRRCRPAAPGCRRNRWRLDRR